MGCSQRGRDSYVSILWYNPLGTLTPALTCACYPIGQTRLRLYGLPLIVAVFHFLSADWHSSVYSL